VRETNHSRTTGEGVCRIREGIGGGGTSINTATQRGRVEGREEIVDAGGELQSVPDGSRTELCGYHFTVPSPVNPPYSPRRSSPSR